MPDPIKLNTVFMGTSSFAATILQELIRNNYHITSVYTGKDKKIGREQKIQKSAVKTLSEGNNLQIFQPDKFDEETIGDLKAQKPDLIIVADYGRILPKEVLALPGFGALNVHASLLPKYRGPSPVQNAILDGELETGTTVMLMNEGIDTGEIISQERIPITPEEKYPELLKKIAEISSELLVKTLPLWVERKIPSRVQDESQATNCQLIERSDGKILWTDSAVSLYNSFRAFFLWPGIFTYLEKDGCNLRLKLVSISLLEYAGAASRQIGEVFQDGEKVAVQTGEGVIILEEVQLEGKNKINVTDFVNGYPEFIGSLLK